MAKDIEKNPDIKRVVEWLRTQCIASVNKNKGEYNAYSRTLDYILIELEYSKPIKP